MIGQGVLICLLGFAILGNIAWRIRQGRPSAKCQRLPEILIGLYLVIIGILTSARIAEHSPLLDPNFAALILLFLPAAISLSDRHKSIGTQGHDYALIWIILAAALAIFGIANYDKIGADSFGIASSVAFLLFLCTAMVMAEGFHRFLLGLAILIWGTYLIEFPFMGTLGISIFAGAITFSATAQFAQKSSFAGIDCETDDFLMAIENPYFVMDLSGKIVYANDSFLRMSGYEKEQVVGSEGINYFDIPNDWRFKLDSSTTLKKMQCHLVTKTGAKIAVDLWINEIGKSGRTLKNLFCIVADQNDREFLQNRLKTESARFSSLYETSMALSSSLELKDVLKAISEAAESLTKADSCTIFALDHGQQIIKPIFSTEASFNSEVMNFELPVGQGLTGKVVQDGRARIQNYDDEVKFAKQIPGTSEVEESLLSIPLVARDVVIGALTLYKLGRKKFEEEDLRVFTVFAAQASAIIQTSRLYMRLKESEKLYRYSVDLSADAILFVDFDSGKINDANETACQMLKYSKSELASMSVWELQPESEMHVGRELWQKARKNGRFMLNEIEYRAKDDEIIPASVNVSAIYAGDTNFIQWTVRDISIFKKVLEKAGLFYQIFERLDEAVFIADSKGKSIYANSSFCSQFCLDSKLIERSDLLSLGLRSPQAAILKSCWEKLRGQDLLVETINLSFEQSNPLRKIVTILPQRNIKGKIEYYIWFFSPLAEAHIGRKSISEVTS